MLKLVLLLGCNSLLGPPSLPEVTLGEVLPIPDPPTPKLGSTVFIAMGDQGTGGYDQLLVANLLEQWCEARGCDFLIGLGDNFYPSGITDIDDEKFETHFESVYSAVNFPFYMSLGNHDVIGDVDAQIAYTKRSQKWKMLGRYYTFEIGHATFLALDSNLQSKEQDAFVADVIDNTVTKWNFAYGHHPIRTNGGHMDATAEQIKSFKQLFCGKLDIYFAGHDHNLQLLDDECDVGLVVSGAGGYTLYSTSTEDNTIFGASTHGFVDIEMTSEKVVLRYVDIKGNIIHESSRKSRL